MCLFLFFSRFSFILFSRHLRFTATLDSSQFVHMFCSFRISLSYLILIYFSSVLRSACGLSVNILPYRHQPICFWKEILKQLMHSMSMSMIRDKAVANFVERLQRTTLAQFMKSKNPKSSNSQAKDSASLVPAGWLELRKGYHTYLNEKNDLIIIREGILFKNLVTYNPATTKNQMIQGKLKSSNVKSSSSVSSVVPATESNEFKKEEDATEGKVLSLDCPPTLFIVTNRLQLSFPSTNSVEEKMEEMSLTSAAETLTASHDLAFDRSQLLSLSKEDYGMEMSLSSPPKQLNYGPWKISVQLEKVFSVNDSQHSLPATKNKLFKNVEEIIFNERFSYEIYWPIILPPGKNDSSSTSSLPFSYDLRFILLKDFLKLFENQLILPSHSITTTTATTNEANHPLYSFSTHFFHEDTTLFPEIIHSLSMELRSMEVRLRDGLPFFIPCFIDRERNKILNYSDYYQEENDNKYFIQMKVVYELDSELLK
jgi:hypothetical protein